jgi:hypothetical protein
VKLRFYQFLFAFLLSVSLFANVGSSSGAGGGVAEKNIIFAFLNLPKFMDQCLASPRCRLTEIEKKWLGEIRASHGIEGSAEKQIMFLSEKANPGFFKIDGLIRLAKTGWKVGDIIYFNQDLLYVEGKAGISPLSLGSSVAHLIHELGHHHGIMNHDALDLLGSKVETNLEVFSQKVLGALLGEYVNLTLLYPSFEPSGVVDEEGVVIPKGISTILINDEKGIVDISNRIYQKLSCDHLFSEPGEQLGGQIVNLHVTRHQNFNENILPQVSSKLRPRVSDQRLVFLSGEALVACRNKKGKIHSGRPKLWIAVLIQKLNTQTQSYQTVDLESGLESL